MDKKAIAKAYSRLRIASRAIATMENSKTHEDFLDAWYVFLTAAKNVYTVLETGAKANPRSRQWYGALAAERRRNYFLQYIYQARHDNEHGLEFGLKAEPVGPTFGVQECQWRGKRPIQKGRNVYCLNGRPAVLEWRKANIRLTPIRDRGNVRLEPPASSSPVQLAVSVLFHLVWAVEEAERLS